MSLVARQLKVQPRPHDEPELSLELELPRLLERMHRRFLDLLQAEMRRLKIRDLTPVQAFLLLDMGDDELTTQELIDRGYYVRANALYNIRKLVEAGYFQQTRDPHDRRAMRIALTDAAKARCAALRARITEIQQQITTREGGPTALEEAHNTLRRLERRWDEYLRYGSI